MKKAYFALIALAISSMVSVSAYGTFSMTSSHFGNSFTSHGARYVENGKGHVTASSGGQAQVRSGFASSRNTRLPAPSQTRLRSPQ